MASYFGEFNLPTLVKYDNLASSGGDGGVDYADAGGHSEFVPASEEGILSFFPKWEGEADHHGIIAEQAYEGEQVPYDGNSNWLGINESYFANFGGEEEGQVSNGLGEEEYYGSYYSYDDEIEMLPAYAYDYDPGPDPDPWSGREEHAADGGEETGYGFSWDELKLVESIFGHWQGHWPCLLDDYRVC